MHVCVCVKEQGCLFGKRRLCGRVLGVDSAMPCALPLVNGILSDGP